MASQDLTSNLDSVGPAFSHPSRNTHCATSHRDSEYIPDPGAECKWPHPNWHIMSRICHCLALSDSDCDLLIKELKHLDTSAQMPPNVKALRKVEATAIRDSKLMRSLCTIPPPTTRDGRSMIENESVELLHYDILDQCDKLLNLDIHADWITWAYRSEFTSDGVTQSDTGDIPFISEVWTGSWWKREQARIGNPDAKIIVPIMSSDETTVTMTGRKLFPVYVTTANIPRWFRQKRSGWLLLGFQPVIRCIKAFHDSDQVRKYRREVKRWCMGVLLSPLIVNASGYLFHHKSSDERFVVYPRFPFFVSDEPEVKHATSGVFMGGNCNRPCTNCDARLNIHTAAQPNGFRVAGAQRDMQHILKFFDPIHETSTITPHQSKELSIHPEFNPVFFVPGYDPFLNPACRLHQFDQGNYVYVKELVIDFLEKCCVRGSGAIARFDFRWSLLCAYPGGKLFRRGVSSLSWVTGHEHRIMGMGLPFVVRGLEAELGLSTIEGYSDHLMEDLCITYLCMRWLVASDGFTSKRLDALELIIHRFQDLLDHLNLLVHGTPKVGCIKFHRLVHWRQYVECFGVTGGYDSGVFESGHKDSCKMWKDSVSFKNEGFAAAKMMRKWEIAEFHTDGAPGMGISQFVSNESEGLSKRLRTSYTTTIDLQETISTQIPISQDGEDSLDRTDRDRGVDDIESLDHDESVSQGTDATTSLLLQESQCQLKLIHTFFTSDDLF
jgi:hypothetical protein